MAKKEKLKSSGEFNFDDNLGLPDFDFDLAEPKDDRKPVKKALDVVKSGAIGALKSVSFLSCFVVPRFLKNAYNLGKQTKSGGR